MHSPQTENHLKLLFSAVLRFFISNQGLRGTQSHTGMDYKKFTAKVTLFVESPLLSSTSKFPANFPETALGSIDG